MSRSILPGPESRLAVAFLIPVLLASSDAAAEAPLLAALDLGIEVKHVMGAETCRDCHAAAYEAWEHSTHFSTFKNRHRTEAADEILQKLNLTSMKRNDVCIQCHYTPQMVEDSVQPVSGVSCESCHGPGQRWTSPELHHEAAGKAESPDARETVLRQCEEVGMLRPRNVARVARNCYGCHTVPEERLVNVGGHPPGSAFELVSWSQGEVRHNFLYTPDESNRPATAERKRVLFVVGAITELEYTIRGYGAITERGTFRSALQQRKNGVTERLDAIAAAVAIPELSALLEGLPRNDQGGIAVSRALIASLPDQATKVADAIATTYDGTTLAGLDTLIPTGVKGTAQP